MSAEDRVQVTLEEKKEEGKLSKARGWLGSKIAGKQATERMQDTWRRIHRIGGFLPIFVEGRLEIRTQKQQVILDEITKDMNECKTMEKMREVMHEANMKVYTLFHITASQWMGGLKESRFAIKIRAYMEFFQRTFDSPSFASDLFTASMAMINYSWKPEDVGSVPPYLIESKTVFEVDEKKGRIDANTIKEY